jgi:hypothetical protein
MSNAFQAVQCSAESGERVVVVVVYVRLCGDYGGGSACTAVLVYWTSSGLCAEAVAVEESVAVTVVQVVGEGRGVVVLGAIKNGGRLSKEEVVGAQVTSVDTHRRKINWVGKIDLLFLRPRTPGGAEVTTEGRAADVLMSVCVAGSTRLPIS